MLLSILFCGLWFFAGVLFVFALFCAGKIVNAGEDRKNHNNADKNIDRFCNAQGVCVHKGVAFLV